MELIINISQFFLLSLALGMSVYSLLVSTELTGAGFYRVVVGIIGGALVLSFVVEIVQNPAISSPLIAYVALFVILVLLFKLHEDKRSPFMWLLYSLKVCLILWLSFNFMNGNVENFLFYISSVALLGSVTFTMILGHWYLVTPRLTEKPLAVGLNLMWGILAIKVLLTIYGYLDGKAYFENFSEVGMGYTFNWIMLIMRAAWGYLVIIIMSYFAYRLVKMRSLQSATGILYAMTFFIFIGELISSYLFYQYGLML